MRLEHALSVTERRPDVDGRNKCGHDEKGGNPRKAVMAGLGPASHELQPFNIIGLNRTAVISPGLYIKPGHDE